MFKHVKETEYHVRVSQPDPRYATLLLQQLGGPNGELTAGLQYLTQSFACDNPKIRDMMQDIAAEEFSHLEMVGECIALLLGNMQNIPKNFPAMSMAIEGGGPMLFDSAGIPWSASYINSNGDLWADLHSNVAGENRAKLIYERLLHQTDDPGVKDMIRFLLSREESHATSFSQALAWLPKGTGTMKDFRDSDFSKMYANLSTGAGDSRGPWNQGHGFRYNNNPSQNFGSLPGYGKDPSPHGHNEIGPGTPDPKRNNPNWQHQDHKSH